MIMSYLDEDESGTIEYNEFAPLMFNWMVEALKLGRAPHKARTQRASAASPRRIAGHLCASRLVRCV